jgi:hypothetical protein
MSSLLLGALHALARVTGGELRLKLEAYEIYRRASSIGRENGRLLPLGEAVARALRGPAGRILWTVEGLGHDDAARRATGGGTAWLAEGLAATPPVVRVPLVTGFGMALAEQRLPSLSAASAADRERGVAHELAEWRAALPPAWAELLIEAQGFAARLLHPRLLGPLAGAWRSQGPEAGDCFWHGAGRAAYFSIGHVVPGSAPSWRGALFVETADDAIRTNLLSGLAFAVALVAMRAPHVLEAMLRDHAGRPDLLAAIRHGVTSAIVVWHAAAAHDPVLAAWRAHPPASAEAARLWGEWIAGPCDAALASGAEPLAAPGPLFRYRP